MYNECLKIERLSGRSVLSWGFNIISETVLAVKRHPSLVNIIGLFLLFDIFYQNVSPKTEQANVTKLFFARRTDLRFTSPRRFSIVSSSKYSQRHNLYTIVRMCAQCLLQTII